MKGTSSQLQTVELWTFWLCNWRCSSIEEGNKLKLKLFRAKRFFLLGNLWTGCRKISQTFPDFEALFIHKNAGEYELVGSAEFIAQRREIFVLMPSSLSTGRKFEKRGRFPTDLISELQLLIIIVSGNSFAFATMNSNEREFKFVISPFFSLAFLYDWVSF